MPLAHHKRGHRADDAEALRELARTIVDLAIVERRVASLARERTIRRIEALPGRVWRASKITAA